MAAFTSKASGNANAGGQTTWNEVGVPGDGDTATVQAGHTVTVTAPWTLGAAGATGTAALTIGAAADAGGGALVVNADLTLKGDLIQRRNHSVTVAAGVTVLFQVGAGVTYKWSTVNDPFVNWATIDLNGTVGSGVTIRAQGGGVGYLDWDAGAVVRVFPDFVTLNSLGDAAQDALQYLANSDTAQLIGTGLLFKNCGIVRFDASTGACTIDLDQVDIRTPLGAQSLITQGTIDKTGGLREITNLVLYSATAKEAFVSGRDWVIEGVSVNHKLNTNAGRRCTLRVFHVATVAVANAQVKCEQLAGHLLEQSAFVANYDNQHGVDEVVLGAGAGLAGTIIQDSVFDYDGFIGTDTGDAYIPRANSVFTFRRNILLGKAGHISMDEVGARGTILHNTFYDALPVRPQGDNADALHIVALRGNLVVGQDSGVTMLHPNGVAGLYARATTFACDYNGYFGLTGPDNLVHPVHLTRGYLDFPAVNQVAGIAATAGTTTTQVAAAAATFVTSGVQAGDYWFNSTRALGVRIQSVDSETQLTLAEAVAAQVAGDAGVVRRSYWSTVAKKYGDDTAGQHDLNVDPRFRDPSRTARTWDTANGGLGTLANLIAEVVRLNGWDTAGAAAAFTPTYTLANFLAYLRLGFTPTNGALKGAGAPADGALDLGAVPVGAPVPVYIHHARQRRRR